MSESAAPSGSSGCASEIDHLFSSMAQLLEEHASIHKAHVKQQESTLAAQQKLMEQEKTMIKKMEQIACGPGFMKKDERKENDEKPVPQGERLPAETITRQLKLYRAALNGDWAVAKDIYDKDEGEIRVGITKHGDTALHVAAQANRIDFVKELVKMMKTEDIAKPNKLKCTALFYAAGSGMVEIVEEMMKGNKDIAMARDREGTLPIVRAASLGKEEMVVFLYEQTKDFLTDDDCIELLVKLIETDSYAVALRLLKDRPQLATKRDRNEETALHVLARKNLTSSNQNPCGAFQRYFNLGAKNRKNKQALKLVESLWEQVILLREPDISKLIKEPTRIIFDAANHGNVQFLSILIREYPDLMWKCDENRYTIFHIAVSNRQVELFKFIDADDMKAIADLLVDSTDGEGNNILHLAGKLAPPDRLNVVSGSALQMQRELLWFQAVKKVVPRKLAEAKNKKGLTPRALFSEQHRDLKEKGEKWMKDTASSCMLVATLIATVVFAAALTVPGGNKEDTGLPFFLHNVSFKIFAVSNVISLVASTLSIVVFLSLVTPRYAEKDFLSLLPRKLYVGLGTLFIAIAAMMVVFSATSFIVFTDGSTWIAILVIVVPSVPAILFFYLHFRLFDDILRSVFVSDYLIPKCKTSLFYKEGETKVKQQKKTKQLNGNFTIQCACSTNV
ncbi:hypothetical protein WN944_024597 [Citrus x changshan-huyou]|uniref:PGG domain-containing protein n=1 Tax=Citrus x changshan-huyou TaxID=2935761 RepID=A0AAP0QCR4_9ROSI